MEIVALKYLKMCSFFISHGFDVFNKERVIFVSPESIYDRKYSVAALVPGMAKENSKMMCVF
jgi:hypothetical protein